MELFTNKNTSKRTHLHYKHELFTSSKSQILGTVQNEFSLKRHLQDVEIKIQFLISSPR